MQCAPFSDDKYDILEKIFSMKEIQLVCNIFQWNFLLFNWKRREKKKKRENCARFVMLNLGPSKKVNSKGNYTMKTKKIWKMICISSLSSAFFDFKSEIEKKKPFIDLLKFVGNVIQPIEIKNKTSERRNWWQDCGENKYDWSLRYSSHVVHATHFQSIDAYSNNNKWKILKNRNKIVPNQAESSQANSICILYIRCIRIIIYFTLLIDWLYAHNEIRNIKSML